MTPIPIEKEKVLFVEGKDEIEFFEAFLKKHCLQEIQIIESGGTVQFKKIFPEYQKAPNFGKIISLAIIQDADDKGPQARFDSICSTLKKCNLSPPGRIGSFTESTPKVGVFTIPDGKSEGMLESLCLSTVASKNKALQCVDDFMKCLEQKVVTPIPKNEHKARCRAFLAAMQEDTPSLGVAAQKGYWDFNSDKLKPLLDFLKKI